MTNKEKALDFGTIWLPRQSNEVNRKFHKILSQESGRNHIVMLRLQNNGVLDKFKEENGG